MGRLQPESAASPAAAQHGGVPAQGTPSAASRGPLRSVGSSEDTLDGIELVEEELLCGGLRLSMLRPNDPCSLIDEEAFRRDERLPYWAELWPSSDALVKALPEELSGARVLEVGCGLGVPSLVAASRGARVLATDWYGEALRLLALNAERNAVVLDVSQLNWFDEMYVASLSMARFDLVLASDVAYERRNVAPLLHLFETLGSEVLISDPGRAAGQELLGEATRRWSVEDLGGSVFRVVV